MTSPRADGTRHYVRTSQRPSPNTRYAENSVSNLASSYGTLRSSESRRSGKMGVRTGRKTEHFVFCGMEPCDKERPLSNGRCTAGSAWKQGCTAAVSATPYCLEPHMQSFSSIFWSRTVERLRVRLSSHSILTAIPQCTVLQCTALLRTAAPARAPQTLASDAHPNISDGNIAQSTSHTPHISVGRAHACDVAYGTPPSASTTPSTRVSQLSRSRGETAAPPESRAG